ncbi:MAG: hypothetical protein U0235_14215 [Polyangiaceae bacterium]
MKKFRVAAVFYSGMYRKYDASHVYVTLDINAKYFGLKDKVHFIDLRTVDVQNADRLTAPLREAIARPSSASATGVEWAETSSRRSSSNASRCS